MTIQRLTQIAKEQFYGAHVGCRLEVSSALLERLRDMWPLPKTKLHVMGNPILGLTGIPINIDDELPVGAWRLVEIMYDSETGEDGQIKSVKIIKEEGQEPNERNPFVGISTA